GVGSESILIERDLLPDLIYDANGIALEPEIKRRSQVRRGCEGIVGRKTQILRRIRLFKIDTAACGVRIHCVVSELFSNDGFIDMPDQYAAVSCDPFLVHTARKRPVVIVNGDHDTTRKGAHVLRN